MSPRTLLLALAVSLYAGVAAHADDSGYRRPAPRQQAQPKPQPQIPEDYDDYQEENLEQEGGQYMEQRLGPPQDCRRMDCRGARIEQRQEYYCQQPNCNAPAIQPYLGPNPRPIPLPVPIRGPCSVVPTPWGWTITVQGGIALIHGQAWETTKLAVMKLHYANTGICLFYTN
ncbi:MAG: hypothetical protein HC883_06055 [Bdellovibrionaceae bacterium]|nr:hypothetical protein [Pseudobdellovibrionaceae bacterium]